MTTEYVVFSLIAPMGSFGDLAGHERRGSKIWPARSAVLGLIAGAMGIRREEQEKLDALAKWQMAVGVFGTGPVLRDFHTVQSVPTARIKKPQTRAEAVAALIDKDNPVITHRDYMMDCCFGVALWGGDRAEAVISSLNQPAFTPYLGRKSCPLSAPMSARKVKADCPVTALSKVPFLDKSLEERSASQSTEPDFIASDQQIGLTDRIETRWDIPTDRQAWHFARRNVFIHHPEGLE